MVPRSVLPLAALLAACHAALPLAPPPGDVGPDRPVLDATVDGPAGDLTSDLTADNGACTGCVAQPCQNADCVAGTCVLTPRAEGDPCVGSTASGIQPGQCWAAANGVLECCTDCWDQATKTCLLGTATTQCGKGGALCASCAGATCNTVSCVSQTCTLTPLPDGDACAAAAPGVCYGGVCCTGCWDGSACQPGTSTSACGSAGGICSACATILDCKLPVCVAGACKTTNNANGTACTDGTSGSVGMCYAGSCCDGCWSTAAKSCQPGTADAACGDGGDLCLDCTSSTTQTKCLLDSSNLHTCQAP